LKKIVTDEWEAENPTATTSGTTGPDTPAPDNSNQKSLPKGHDIAFRNKIVQCLFRAESDEVKAEVARYLQTLTDDSDQVVDGNMDDEETKRAAKAQQYHEYVFEHAPLQKC
jgi:hypothetical protein